MTKKSFIKGTLILTVGAVVVKIIGFLNWIILSRILGGEGIGLYQMAFPLYLLALDVSTAGIPVAISIITAEKIALNDYYGARRVFKISLSVMCITGLIFSFLLYYGADWLIYHRFIRDSRAYYSLIALAPAIFFVTLLSSFRGYLQGWQIMTPTALSQIVEQLVRVLIMIILAVSLLPYGLDYAAGGASFGAAPGALFGLLVLIYYYFKLQRDFRQKSVYQAEKAIKEPAFNIIKRIFKLGLPVSLSAIMLPVVANLDLAVVPARLEVAGYSVSQATELFGYLTGMAVPLVNLSTILTGALATSIVPAVSEAIAVGNQKLALNRALMAIRLSNLVTIPGTIGLFILAEPIATLVYHAPLAGEAISIMALSVYVLGIHQVTTGMLQGMGHTTIPVVNMGISAVIKVVFNYILTAIPWLGIKGAAYATVADIGVAALLNVIFLYRFINFKLSISDLVKPTLASILMGVTTFYCYHFILIKTGLNSLATFTAMILSIVIYSMAIVVIGGITRSELEQMPLIGRRIANLLNRLGMLR